MTVLQYEDLREARRQILAVQDPQAQAALFTVLGLLHQLAEAFDHQNIRGGSPSRPTIGVSNS